MQLAELIETLHRLGHRQWAKAGSQLGVSYSEYEYLNGQGIYNDAAEMMLSKLSDRDRSDLAVLLAKLKQKT